MPEKKNCRPVESYIRNFCHPPGKVVVLDDSIGVSENTASMLHVPVTFVVNLNLSINFFKAKLLAIILFGPELALHNVFPLPTTNFCSTIAFILLSAYAFYLDQFEI